MRPYPHPRRSPRRAPRPGHLDRLLRPRRRPLRPAHLPVALRPGRAADHPAAARQGPAARRPGHRRPDPVAAQGQAPRRLPLPHRPGPPQTGRHPRPVGGDRPGAGRPPHLPHLPDREGLLHPALDRRMQRLRGRGSPMMAPPSDRRSGVNRTLTPKRRTRRRRERRLRRVHPARHPRLQPPRRLRRHRRPHRHGHPVRRPRPRHHRGHHRAAHPARATPGPTSAPGSASPGKPPSNAGAAPPPRSRPSTAPAPPGAARDPDRLDAGSRTRTPPRPGYGGEHRTRLPRHLRPLAGAGPRQRVHPRPRRLPGHHPPRPRPTGVLRGQRLLPRRLRPVARSHLARRRMHPPHPPRRPDPPRRPRHRRNHLHPADLGAAGRGDLQSLRQPPRLGLPVLRGDLPAGRLPAHPRRADRRQRRPRHVAGHPAVFATFTAPSFGPVHSRPVRPHTCTSKAHCRCQPQPCHARRDTEICPHGRKLGLLHPAPGAMTPGSGSRCARTATTTPPMWCGTTTPANCGGAPSKPSNATSTSSPATAASPYGVRVSHGKAAEYQARGAVHFHVLLRLDGLDDARPRTAPAPTARASPSPTLKTPPGTPPPPSPT